MLKTLCGLSPFLGGLILLVFSSYFGNVGIDLLSILTFVAIFLLWPRSL